MKSGIRVQDAIQENPRSPSRASGVPLKTLALLCALALVLNWADFQDFRPNMDTQTYGILARNILRTGDWLHLHYTTQAYADFFQHPPLGIWILALVFKFTGASEGGIKIASSVFLLGTSVLTSLFAAFLVRVASPSTRGHAPAGPALLAGLILLFSVRFLKPSSGYLLDAPLTFFFTGSAFAFAWACTEGKPARTRTLALSSGLLFVLAILSKGLPALVLPVGIFLLSVQQKTLRSHFAPFSLAALTPLAALSLHPDIRAYAHQYWVQSVSNRLGGPVSWKDHLAPFILLARTWWPWLPLGLFTAGRISRRFATRPLDLQAGLSAFPVVLAGGILLGFALNGHFLEHYALPFYPLAAASLASELSPLSKIFEAHLHRMTFALLGTLALAVALLPIDFQGKGHREPLWQLLHTVNSRCPSPEKSPGSILFLPGTIGRWEGLALGAWVTGRSPWVLKSGEPAPGLESTVLIRKAGMQPPAGWLGHEIARMNSYIAEVSPDDSTCR